MPEQIFCWPVDHIFIRMKPEIYKQELVLVVIIMNHKSLKINGLRIVPIVSGSPDE